jgi:hypothetical protein
MDDDFRKESLGNVEVAQATPAFEAVATTPSVELNTNVEIPTEEIEQPIQAPELAIVPEVETNDTPVEAALIIEEPIQTPEEAATLEAESKNNQANEARVEISNIYAAEASKIEPAA